MNYLDFSHKIMLYLQMKGLLFRFEVLSEAGVSAVAEIRNGLPFKLDIKSIGEAAFDLVNADGLVSKIRDISESAANITAINGDGVIRKIEQINAETWAEAETVVGDAVFANVDIKATGEVDIQILRAAGQIAETEDVQSISEAIINAVLAQALTAEANITSESKMSVSFAPFNTLNTAFSVETGTAVSAVLRECAGLVARFNETGETSAEFVMAVATAALVRFAVGAESETEFGAVNAAGRITQVQAGSASAASAVLRLMVEATIGHYAGWTIADMGANTLTDLSKIII